MKREIRRQSIHALGALSIVIIILFGKALSIVLFSIWLATLIVTAEFRKNRKELKKHPIFKLYAVDFFEKAADKMVMERERRGEFSLKGPITFYLGCLIALILLPPLLAIIGILILAISDAASTLVGRMYGQHKLWVNPKKSWEGSITFFIASLLILYLFLNPTKALALAITITVIEMLPVNDNITIPISTGLLLYLFI